jgi:hypothetical protein
VVVDTRARTVTNAGEGAADTVVAITLDGQLHAALNVRVPARGRAERVLSLPAGARLIEVRLPAGDALALDDQATAVVPESGGGRVLLVSAGNCSRKALALLPGVSSSAPIPPSRSRPATSTSRCSTADLGHAPAGDLLLIAPAR